MIWKEQIRNASFTLVDALDLVADDGSDVLVVVAKLSFKFDDRGRLRLVARPHRRNDVVDELGAPRYPADFTLSFEGTDCVVLGTAHPGIVPADSRFVSIAVGSVRKTVKLFGPRVYMSGPRGVRPGPSGNIVVTPLRHEWAYGGRALGTVDREYHNPIGRGFSVKPEELVGVEAHRLEPLEPSTIHASSGCFAPISSDWAPRRDLCGTFDEAWRRRRAPTAPRDRDPLFHSVVRPEQRSRVALTLPFAIELRGFTGDDATKIELPAYGIRVMSELFDGATAIHDSPISRVTVDVDERVVEINFVAHVPLPMKWEKLRAIHVSALGSLPDEMKLPEGRA
jgi:hypothetical protein